MDPDSIAIIAVVVSLVMGAATVLMFFSSRNSSKDGQIRDNADGSLGRSIDKDREEVEKLKTIVNKNTVTIRENVYSIEKLKNDMNYTLERTTTETKNKIESLEITIISRLDEIEKSFSEAEKRSDKKDKQFTMVMDNYGTMWTELMESKASSKSGK